MQQFHEKSAFGQLGILLAMISGLGLPFGAVLLFAGDQAIDQKYATDADVLAVQTTVAKQVEEIKTTVEANTKTVRATVSSVDGLTLVVIDLQIDKIESEIRALEKKKRLQGAAWNELEEDALRDKQKALADINTQRAILFARLIASQTGVTP